MIAFVSKNTAKADGAIWEVKVSEEEGVPVVAVYTNSGSRTASLPVEYSYVKKIEPRRVCQALDRRRKRTPAFRLSFFESFLLRIPIGKGTRTRIWWCSACLGWPEGHGWQQKRALGRAIDLTKRAADILRSFGWLK